MRHRPQESSIPWGFLLLLILGSLLLREALANPFCQVLLNREERGEAELAMTVRGIHAGLFRYRMVGETSNVTGMFMQESFKGKRLSGAFIHAMLLRNPEIKTVKALMVMDNLAASGLMWVKRAITPEECIKASGRTPFAKSFTRFGFKLSKCYWNESIHYLEIEMSK